jgi:hypothetical protein
MKNNKVLSPMELVTILLDFSNLTSAVAESVDTLIGKKGNIVKENQRDVALKLPEALKPAAEEFNSVILSMRPFLTIPILLPFNPDERKLVALLERCIKAFS